MAYNLFKSYVRSLEEKEANEDPVAIAKEDLKKANEAAAAKKEHEKVQFAAAQAMLMIDTGVNAPAVEVEEDKIIKIVTEKSKAAAAKEIKAEVKEEVKKAKVEVKEVKEEVKAEVKEEVKVETKAKGKKGK